MADDDAKPAATSVPPPAIARASAPEGRAAADAPKQDVVLLGPPTADGGGVHVLRARDERLEAGELRTVQEGRPLVGELVTLAPRKENPRICDVKDSFTPPAARTMKGPAQVATQAYRDRWDEVFARRDDDAN